MGTKEKNSFLGSEGTQVMGVPYPLPRMNSCINSCPRMLALQVVSGQI